MTLKFTEHPDVVFTNDPLLLVLTQIRFQPIYSLVTDAAIVGFQELLRSHYPVLEKELTADIQLGTEAKISQQVPVWRFSDQREWEWRVSLAVDFVSLETREYGDFSDFSRRLSQVLAALEQALHPSTSTRIGLRKVNELKHDSVEKSSDWSSFIRTELLGIAALPDLPVAPTLYFSNIHFAVEDSVLAVRHGISPDDPLAYRLDLDHFTERTCEISPSSALVPLLQDFSNSMTSFFHWALDEDFKKQMRPIPRDQGGK